MSTGPGPTPAETIGQRLKRLRLEQGLSQRELASPGVSYAYISRIEAGTRQPSVKALRRLGAKLGVSAEYLETGSVLDPAERRELRLADLELAIRLGESEGVEERLQELVDEAVAAGDTACALRGRVALASVALESGAFGDTVTLLEAALEDEPFAPVDRFEIYANLGRAYSGTGRSDQAVDLFERCLAEVEASGGDSAISVRYATLLSYALSDGGDLARAERVVQDALERAEESEDPYMRVRLYWSMARLAHQEGRASVALTNVRKAIALLQATDDSFHLARAHILAAGITLTRDDVAGCERHLDHAEQLLGPHPSMPDAVEIKVLRSRVAVRHGDAVGAVDAGPGDPRSRRGPVAGGRGTGLRGARRRARARRRVSRRRRGVPPRSRSAGGAGPMARRDPGVPLVGAHAPRHRARGTGARRARPCDRARSAGDADGRPIRALSSDR